MNRNTYWAWLLHNIADCSPSQQWDHRQCSWLPGWGSPHLRQGRRRQGGRWQWGWRRWEGIGEPNWWDNWLDQAGPIRLLEYPNRCVEVYVWHSREIDPCPLCRGSHRPCVDLLLWRSDNWTHPLLGGTLTARTSDIIIYFWINVCSTWCSASKSCPNLSFKILT